MRHIVTPESWSGPSRALLVPCGRCAFCLVNKRAQWVFRMHYEVLNQEYPGYFLTLTYDPKHVPRRDGELSLRFKDVQLYFKRVRKAGFYCKYVCVGEYGSKTERPHYHMLLWTDASVGFLQDNWKSSRDGSPLGLVHFGTVTPASVMYAMKYIVQPRRDYGKREKPRAQFSKGLGLSFLSVRMYDFLTEDYENPVMTVKVDGQEMALPRYYRAKIFTRYQMRIEGYRVKEVREKEKEKELSELRARGVSDPEAYLKRLRVERANRIFTKVKKDEIL